MTDKIDSKDINSGDDVLIRHPAVGSEWMTVLEVTESPDGRPWLNLETFEELSLDSMLPMYITPTWFNFPVSCVAKVSSKAK